MKNRNKNNLLKCREKYVMIFYKIESLFEVFTLLVNIIFSNFFQKVGVWKFFILLIFSGKIFFTWEGYEIDKYASIWLIKRFIDKNAEIKILPKYSNLSKGIPFDIPYAKLKRYYNMSTFETILKFYNIKDPKLTYIGKIIHDIEINIWEEKKFKETENLQNIFLKIVKNSKSYQEIIEKSCKYFDILYQKLKLP